MTGGRAPQENAPLGNNRQNAAKQHVVTQYSLYRGTHASVARLGLGLF